MKGKYLVLEVKEAYNADKLHYYFSNNLPSVPSNTEYNYIGVEELPFEGEGELLLEMEIRDIWEGNEYKGRKVERNILKNTIPKEVLSLLKEYRKAKLTLDIDETYGNYITPEILNEIYKLGYARFVKTLRGFHVIVALDKSLNFEERISLRDKLGDDGQRIRYDKTLFELGFEGLTDILFDYKWWEGEKEFHKWQETNLINIKGTLSFNMPKMELQIGNKQIKIEGSSVYITNIEPSRARWIVQSIDSNFWDYAKMLEFKSKELPKVAFTRDEEDIINAFLSVLHEVDWKVWHSLTEYQNKGLVEFRLDYNVLNVVLKEDAISIAGRIIGKGGSKIKEIQAKLGMNVIVITTEKQKAPSEQEILKQKFEDLLKRLL
jgi:hypothetical protein